MAKNNSANQDYTNNADGWDLTGGTTGRKLTVTGANITLTGSGTNVYTFPGGSDTLAALGTIETWTAAQSFNSSKLILNGSSSGTTTLNSGAAASSSVLTLPVATDTLVAVALAQTLTNKTLTTPIIDQFNTASGVGAAWGSWTPTWTNMVVTNSTVTARFIQLGKTVFYRIAVVLAGGDKPSGAVSFSFPVTSISYAGTATLPVIGQAQYFIGSGFTGPIVWRTTTVADMDVTNTAGTYATTNNISATVPGTFANGSELHAGGFYQVA